MRLTHLIGFASSHATPPISHVEVHVKTKIWQLRGYLWCIYWAWEKPLVIDKWDCEGCTGWASTSTQWAPAKHMTRAFHPLTSKSANTKVSLPHYVSVWHRPGLGSKRGVRAERQWLISSIQVIWRIYALELWITFGDSLRESYCERYFERFVNKIYVH